VPELKVVPAEPEPEVRPRLVSLAAAAPERSSQTLVNLGTRFTGRSQIEDLEIPTFIRRQMD